MYGPQSGLHHQDASQGYEAVAPTPWQLLRRQPPAVASCSAQSWDCAWQRFRPPPAPSEPWPAPTEMWAPEPPESPPVADPSGFCIPPDRSVLIKNCLKLTIRQRREALGLGDIAPDYKTTGPEEVGAWLTQEDEEKRNKRRERNKIAASKCRNRKKERTVRLSEESEDLQRGNAELRRELHRLRQEVQHLSHLLRVHACIAPGASGPR